MPTVRWGSNLSTGVEDLDADHQAMIDLLKQLGEAVEDGAEFGAEITEFIRTWLVSHILESDKQLGGYLRAKTRG